MKPWLALSRVVDALTDRVGQGLMWLILAAVLISAGNAIVRKAFNISSNALLEMQWYLFSGVFLLGAGYAFLKNVHVRIDFVSGRLSPRARTWIDIVGIVVFLMPLCWMLIQLSLAAVRQGLAERRDVAERRRPDPLAGLSADARSASPCCCCRRSPS